MDLVAGIASLFDTTDWSFAPTFTDVDDHGWPDRLVSGDFGTSQEKCKERCYSAGAISL